MKTYKVLVYVPIETHSLRQGSCVIDYYRHDSKDQDWEIGKFAAWERKSQWKGISSNQTLL